MTAVVTVRQGLLLGVLAVLTLGAVYAIPKLWEDLDAKHIMVIQSPVSGELSVFTEPGVKWQGFGQVTKYLRRSSYEFDIKDVSPKGEPTGKDTSKRLRFNDGGHGYLYGATNWEMPLKPAEIIAIHKVFGSPEGVESAAIGRMIDAAVYLAGPLMSSTESSGERRAELVQYINDQAEHGVYVTRVVNKEIVDPITKERRELAVTEIVRDEKGEPRRQQGSILQDFNIKLLPLSIKELSYDSIVEDQIKQRQAATTQVQIAQANAKRAEQEKLTTEAQGAANAAKTRWEQEAIKARVVTEAEQKLRVAELAAKEAEQYKREQILRGEGDAQRKQLVMNADGALDQKLQAIVEINARYAKAIETAQPGAWSPVVLMGSANGSAASGAANATTLVDLLTAKTARDLGVDLSVAGKAATAPRAVGVKQ